MRPADLEKHLWRLSDKLAMQLRENEFCAGGVVLKLKTAAFAIRTRAGQRKPVTADFFPAYDEDGGLLVALTPRARETIP